MDRVSREWHKPYKHESEKTWEYVKILTEGHVAHYVCKNSLTFRDINGVIELLDKKMLML